MFTWEQCMSLRPHRLDGMPVFQRPAVRATLSSGGQGGDDSPGVGSGLWYRAVASDASIAAKQLPLISDYFAEALYVAGSPDRACLFMTGSFSSPSPDHSAPSGTAIIYFSPAAIELVPHLIASCGAAPSPPPDRAGATLLVGKLSDWGLLPYAHH